jgi:sugar phosphate isomerase/epimerase
MISRRQFGGLVLAGFAFPRAFDSVVSGVRLGVQTYSFREMPRMPGQDHVDTIIKAMTACGVTECELFAPQVEPQFSGGLGRRGASPSPEAVNAREALRKWRLETSVDHFRDIRKKFASAGISIYAYNYSPNPSYTDAEIDRGFEMTRALGAEIITASTTLDVAKRIKPFAEKYKMVVSMHGHSNVTDPNELATPASFAAAMALSPFFKINLDIGHFTAANFDALAYIREQHANITNLHLKDRRKNQGDNMPWGQGETPIREVLQLLKKEQWPVRAYIEYEYRGAGSPVDEVKKCSAYARNALT